MILEQTIMNGIGNNLRLRWWPWNIKCSSPEERMILNDNWCHYLDTLYEQSLEGYEQSVEEYYES